MKNCKIDNFDKFYQWSRVDKRFDVSALCLRTCIISLGTSCEIQLPIYFSLLLSIKVSQFSRTSVVNLQDSHLTLLLFWNSQFGQVMFESPIDCLFLMIYFTYATCDRLREATLTLSGGK